MTGESPFAILFGAVAIGVVGVITVGIIFAVRAAQRERVRFLEAAAKRLKGRAIAGGFLRNHSIIFPLGPMEATVEFVPAGEDDRGRTSVNVFLEHDAPGTLHIVPDGFGQSFLKMFGAQDLTIGDPSFDAAYVVKATPESLAAEVFRPDRRERVIAAVRRLSPFVDPTIELTRSRFRVQVREDLKNESSLVALVKTAEEFLEFVRITAPVTGIQLEELKTSRDSACPVCGTPLAGQIVRCESCKAPHHRECWTYVGQCSTYACKGKRFVT